MSTSMFFLQLQSNGPACLVFTFGSMGCLFEGCKCAYVCVCEHVFEKCIELGSGFLV